MDVIITLALFALYVFSAVLTAVAYPLHRVRRLERWNDPKRGFKHYVTYGHIIGGLLLAILPLFNTLFLADQFFTHFADKKIFKEKKIAHHR